LNMPAGIASTAYKRRAQHLQAELGKLGLRGALITDPANLFYLSGHLIAEGNGPALLFVPGGGAPVLIIHEDEEPLLSVQSFSGGRLTYTSHDAEDGLHAASRCFRREFSGAIFPLGIEPDSLPIQSAVEIGLVSTEDWGDVQGIIARFRQCKDPVEIELLRVAATIADTGQKTARELYREGLTEIELLSGCRTAMEREAGRPIGFLADVLFGSATALIGSPGGVAGEGRAARSDPAIVDLLPRVSGYFADTTRTLWAGEPSADRRDVVDLLMEVKKVLEGLLRPGVQAVEVDGAARERLDREGSFPHHTGHGIGISHYEPPFIRQDSRDVLETGNVITLEPGLYYDDWGARIEDDYLITTDGFEKLTGSEDS
jgi:Xaa-Pro dipeptidase